VLDLIPARMINEFAYCPRLFHIEYVQGDYAANEDTVQGATVHRRVEDEAGWVPPADELAPEDRIAARAVLLSAPALGVIAKLDILEGLGGLVRPVDYKKGRPGPHGPWEPELVQLCAQGLVLRENGYQCQEGVLYYAETRTRHVVQFDEALIARTCALLEQLRAAIQDPVPPPPLIDSPKCPRCSLVGICLPDEVNFLRDEPLREVRRLLSARDDAGPIYVLSQGATVGKSGDRIAVRTRDGQEEFTRLLDVSQLCLFGNVAVTPPAIRALAEREVPIFHHTYGGWLAAITTGLPHRNVELRASQYRLADDDAASLAIARAIVSGKIRNQRILVRRNARFAADRTLRELARLASAAGQASSAEVLLGIEGMAARTYFASFGRLLGEGLGFNFEARLRRPPPDPVNALLSFLYSLLVKECVHALLAVGLDPHRGFYHRLRYGRPSLALDLAEEFRPLLADSAVLTLVKNRMVDNSDFIVRGPSCALTDSARREVIAALEARIDTLVRHPLFGYSMSYRRVLEVQARLLARCVSGELPSYRPFVTR
jgi:CRISPR-associated protein Cas1